MKRSPVVLGRGVEGITGQTRLGLQRSCVKPYQKKNMQAILEAAYGREKEGAFRE
jgi:hypothetical protein